MKKILLNLKNNWILYIIVLQPILDIISYFQTKFTGSSLSWVVRIVMLIVVFMIAFLKSKNKKKLILSIVPFGMFFIIHILNLYRINELNILLDVKYFMLVFQLPILTILLIDYIKNTNYDLIKIKKAICYNFIIIITSILIAYLTKSYETTYSGIGIIGWFSSANTQSMIICAISPWFLYVLFNFKKPIFYVLGCIITFVILFFNGTRSCYYTLLASLLVMLFSLMLSKNEEKRIVKICIIAIFILVSFFAYKYSFTFDKQQTATNVTQDYIEDIKSTVKEDIVEDIEDKENNNMIDINTINLADDKLIVSVLKTSYLYSDLMEIHGEQTVADIMKPYISASALSDNRLVKVINAKIEYEDSDSITKLLGIGYSRIQNNSLDLENDLQAIFYYYGYIGMALYSLFILYFLVKLAILFFKKFSIIRDKEYVILAFLVLFLIIGGEYSGAFLRKPNANIYLSLYLVLMYFKLESDFKVKCINKKKVTFLLLHLGYGGIESATINTANALSEKYDVELISFYNLKENQAKELKENISIKYLYEGEPNKKEFKQAIKEKNIFKVLKEGFKAIDILAKKRYLIKKEIQNSNSFAIVSTRYDFSVILNKYGRKDIIKIAQEHHHHNNNKKYIKIISNKYKKIDYLFALTNNLKKDYEKFLVKNKHTKIMVVPNMITSNPEEQAPLNTNNIITISRLHEGKRINELINIFSKIENKDTKLYIIGSGDEEQNLKHQINTLGLEQRVIMTGYLNKEEQLKYILDSSVYVMTSISEGLPMVLLEAMQLGIPCIAYETDSGVEDIINNNKNGFIIKNRDEKKYINKLDTLLKNYELRKSMSINCIKTREKFKEEKICKIWFKILDE